MSSSPGIVQGTRGLMLSSILLCIIAVLVASVGMKCTTCMAEEPQQKGKVALAGGVFFIIAGQSSFRHTHMREHTLFEHHFRFFF